MRIAVLGAGVCGLVAARRLTLAGHTTDVYERWPGLGGQAATLDAQSREALVQSTRLLVQSDVAQAYFGLRALDAERALVRQTVAAYRDTLRLTERRFAAGVWRSSST